ncbi:hypothetical protein VPH35_004688 [Triticum aestivum]
MPNMTVTRSSAEDPHAAAGEQQQPQRQVADKAPRTTEEEPADFTNTSRYQRINPESVPVPNGSGGGNGSTATRKLAEPVPSPTPSMDKRDGAPAVDANSSSLASYLARASLEQRRPGGRPASSSAAIVSDHQLYNATAYSSHGVNIGGSLYNLAAQASQGSNLDGGLYNLAAQASEAANSLGGGLYNFAAKATQGADLCGELYNLTAQSTQASNRLGSGLNNLAAHATQASNSLGGGLYNLAAQAIEGTDLGGGSSSSDIAIAALEDPAPLKWGCKKRSRAYREVPAPAPAVTPAPASVPAPAPATVPTPAPEPELTPAQAHRRGILRIKNRPTAQDQAQPRAEAEKLMPPPSARGPAILDTSPQSPRTTTLSPLPPRAATLSPLPPRAATLSQHRSSAEDPHAADGKQQQAADKAPGTTEEEPAPKVHEPKPPLPQPYRQAADKAAHASNGEQEPAPKAEPRTPQPQRQRQQPPRQASIKEKGKAPMVQEPPAVAPHAVARPPVPRVATQLTRKKKEEDWFAMTGRRLPYRPLQRHPKAVEDKLQKLFPGQTLPEVTRARYMVREKKQKKRPGLQAMAEEDALRSERRDSDNNAAGEKKPFWRLRCGGAW